MSTTFLLFRARYSQSWGGYQYAKGTPRAVGIHVQLDGVGYLWILYFGAASEVYAGQEATDRLAQDPDAEVYPTLDVLRERVYQEAPALGSGRWMFDGQDMTPALLLARGARVLRGVDPRLSEDERYQLPDAVAERARWARYRQEGDRVAATVASARRALERR